MGTGGLFLRKLRATVKDKPTGFVWVTESVAASGYPASRSQVEWVESQGIGSVLTLTEGQLPPRFTDGLPVQLEHIPLSDHGVPEAHALERGAAYIAGQVAENRKVLVHCLAGEGRTGCVLAAYMVIDLKLTPEEALRTLRKIKPSFVESQQEKAVYGLGEHLVPGE